MSLFAKTVKFLQGIFFNLWKKNISLIYMSQPENFKQILRASYLNQNDAKKKLKGLGYKYDNKLSNNENKVFIDKNGTPNIVSRGSKTAKDWLISDPLLALGLSKYDPRQKATNELVKKVSERYHKDPNLYGHSLGGHLVENAKTTGQKYTLNKGAGIGDLFKTIPKNQHDFRTSNDLVSALSVTQRNKSKKVTMNNLLQNPLSAHTITNLR